MHSLEQLDPPSQMFYLIQIYLRIFQEEDIVAPNCTRILVNSYIY